MGFESTSFSLHNVNIVTGPPNLFSMLALIFDLLTCSRRWQIPQAEDMLDEGLSPVMETFSSAG